MTSPPIAFAVAASLPLLLPAALTAYEIMARVTASRDRSQAARAVGARTEWQAGG